MNRRRSLIWLTVAMLTPWLRPAAQTDPRAALLKLIERRRVPLSPQVRVRPDGGQYNAEHFTFASEQGERVTGILMAPASASGRRPVVVVLHGSGARKEEQLGLLRTLADRGFTAGEHRLTWDGADNAGRMSSRGVYFVRSKHADSGFKGISKLIVLK